MINFRFNHCDLLLNYQNEGCLEIQLSGIWFIVVMRMKLFRYKFESETTLI